ncbi:MAG TPA: V-type ATPase 116kDa subunit family protein [Candidatus Anoxymicrobiaceae bacterium]
MAKVEILGLKDIALDAIDVIHDLGTLHIEDLTERIGSMDTKRVTRMEMDPKFAEHEGTLNNLRAKVGDMIRELHPDVDVLSAEDIATEYKGIWSENVEVMISRIQSMLHDVERDTRDTVERKSDLMVELSRLEKYAPIMGKVQPLADRVAKMTDMASIALIIERKYKAILNYLNEEISKITEGECEIISSDVDDESTAALIVFNRRFLKQVHEFLAVQDVNQVRLPSDLSKKPIDEAVAEVRARISQIPSEIDEIDSKLVGVTDKYSVKLLAGRNAIHDRLEAMDAVPKFGQTDQVFIIAGWLPEPEVEPMDKALTGKFGNKVVMTVVDIREEHDSEETPVALHNSPFTRYFEILYLLSKYPRYGTVDPTIVFAFFFPILFGLMVGDIGYGIIILVAGWIVHRKYSNKPFVNMIGFVLTVGGAWTIFFGAIYLEFFGDWIYRWLGLLNADGELDKYLLGTKNSTFKYPVDRIEGFTFMLAVCLIIGWVHMGIGLIIGMVNGHREKNYKHVMEKGGLFLVLTGVLMIVAKFGLGWWPAWLAAVGALMAVGGIVLGALGAGMGGAIEAVVGAGNLFSYARLIAIGLASVIMANVANELAIEQAKSGWVGIIVGVIVFILLQTLNLVIGVFSPSIHSLRLHLVESFGKFFEPAKVRYEPFKKTGGEE